MMLTCVCRPVSGNLPKMPPTMLPAPKAPRNAIAITGLAGGIATPTTVVVTAEPKLNVPGRLTSAELRAMALRQQQQIDSQHQLLATKEQRLRFLKSQEVRNAVASAEGERLRRLRERVEAQESKLRRLRALRGQVDVQKTYNVTLSNDLDSIRALFSEKEKELSLAVAKVEALTRQLEELRRDRRCPINLLSTNGNNGNSQPLPPQASRELEKLRRELVYRNQLSLQQDARLHLQREALQQRQAELRSVDQRIYELQTRLLRKKAANIQTHAQNHNQLQVPQHESPHQQQQQQQQHHPLQQQQQQQQHQQTATQQQQSHQLPTLAYNNSNTAIAYKQNQQNNIHHKQGVAALKQQLLQKQASNLQQHNSSKFPNVNNRETSRSIPRGNVAAVEPYIHTPQKTALAPGSGAYLGAGNILKHAAATANTNQQNQLIQDLTHMKHNLTGTNAHSPQGGAPSAHTISSSANAPNAQTFFSGESDESKLAKKMLTASLAAAAASKAAEPVKPVEVDTSMHIYAEVGPKKRDLLKAAEAAKAAADAAARAAEAATTTTTSSAATPTAVTTTITGSKIPKSISSSNSATAMISKLNSTTTAPRERNEVERRADGNVSEALTEKHIQQQQLTVHSMPLGTANKSLANAVSAHTTVTSAPTTTSVDSVHAKSKLLQAHTSSGLAIPPRKPISSVAPTSVTSSIPKMITYSPKVNRVAPNVLTASAPSNAPNNAAPSIPNSAYSDRPALPPKPSKTSPTEHASEHSANAATTHPASTTFTTTTTAASSSTSMLKKPSVHGGAPMATAANVAASNEVQQATQGLQTLNINDNLPIKAKPLTIRKQPMSEQPRLKLNNVAPKPPLQAARKMDIPAHASFLYPADGVNRGERSRDSHMDISNANSNNQRSTGLTNSASSSNASTPEQAPQHAPPQVPSSSAQATTSNHAQHSPNSNSQSSSSMDELDKIERHMDGVSGGGGESNNDCSGGLKRRAASTGSAPISSSLSSATNGNGKPKLARRVSFDPLALLLDASLEGELELVKKTAMQVANPSAANDEGITALHNAICAGHFDIVKFLVEFGCDVNAQDSDGWTPLHCAASCNNLSMVKFLVENGACLFASTLSDHETPAEKCEEDEEGFDGCSEYLYSIQEKLGILHNGEVCAVFSYDAQNSDELTFQVNDRLVVLRKGDDAESEWWWAKNASDEEGYVPRNLLGLYPRVPPQTSNFND